MERVNDEAYQKVYDAWWYAKQTGHPILAWALFVIVKELAEQRGIILP